MPTLNCTDTPTGSADTWVGTGGDGGSSGDLLQTGIEDDCVNGVQQNFSWWFEVSSANEVLGSSRFGGLTVTAGDSMDAYVYQATSGQWVTRIDDLTTGLSGYMVTGDVWEVCPDSGGSCSVQGEASDVSYSGGYTAEWIEEDPGVNPVPFADYGTVSFSDLLLGGLSPWYLTESHGLEIVQNGVVLSTPSLPDNDGFTLSYTGP